MASAAFVTEAMVLDEQLAVHVEGRLFAFSGPSLFFISHDIGPFSESGDGNKLLSIIIGPCQLGD